MLASRPVTLCSAEKVEWHHHQRLLQMHIKKQKATITSWLEKKKWKNGQTEEYAPTTEAYSLLLWGKNAGEQSR